MLFASPGIHERAGIKLIPQHLLNLLFEDRPSSPCPKSPSVQRVRQRGDGVLPTGECLQPSLDEGEAIRVGFVRTSLASVGEPLRVNVTKGRDPGPNPLRDFALDPCLATLLTNVILKLRVP